MLVKEISYNNKISNKTLAEKILYAIAILLHMYDKYVVNILMSLLDPLETYKKAKLTYNIKKQNPEINTTLKHKRLLEAIDSKPISGILYEIKKPHIDELKELYKLPFEIGVYKCKDKWFFIKGIYGLLDFSMLIKIFNPADIQLHIHAHPYNLNIPGNKKLLKGLKKGSDFPPYYCLFPSYADISIASHYKFNNTYIVTKFGVVKYQTFDKNTLDKIFTDYQLFWPLRIGLGQWKKNFEKIMVEWQFATDILTYQEFEKIIDE